MSSLSDASNREVRHPPTSRALDKRQPVRPASAGRTLLPASSRGSRGSVRTRLDEALAAGLAGRRCTSAAAAVAADDVAAAAEPTAAKVRPRRHEEALRMAAVQPGDQMEHQLVLALQHVRVSAAANAELGAENVRLQARATRAEKAVLALTIALRSKDVQLRATTAEIPALEQQLAALASQHSAAAPAAAAQGTASQDMPVDGAEAAARVEAEEKLAFVVAALGKLQGEAEAAAAREARLVRERDGALEAAAQAEAAATAATAAATAAASSVATTEAVAAAPEAARVAGETSPRSQPPAPPAPRAEEKKRGSVRFALAEDAPPPLAAPIAASEEARAAAVPQAPAAPPLERPVWRVGFLAPPKSAPAVPWRLQIASPLGVSSEPEPTFAPEAGPVLPAAPTGKEQPSDVSVTGAPTTAGAYQVSIAPPAEGAASGAPWRVTIDPTPTQPAAEAEPPAPVPAPTPAPKDDWCVSVTPRSASGDDGPWRAASPPGGASESAPADQSEVAPWRVSLNPPAAGGQGWTVSIKPPGGAAEAVVRAPVQEAVVHMMQDGDGHASVQIVAAVAADELVSDALRTALATQTAVPSAAVVEARAAGSEVVAAALNGLSAA